MILVSQLCNCGKQWVATNFTVAWLGLLLTSSFFTHTVRKSLKTSWAIRSDIVFELRLYLSGKIQPRRCGLKYGFDDSLVGSPVTVIQGI